MGGVYKSFQDTYQDLTTPATSNYSGAASTLTPIADAPTPGGDTPIASSAPQPITPTAPATSQQPAGAPSAGGNPAAIPAAPPSAPAGISDLYRPGSLTSVTQIPQEYQGLFKPITGQIGRSGVEDYLAKIRASVDKFGQGAGSRRSYDSAGIEEMLKRAENQGGDLSQAQSALAANYTGPRTLDTDQTGKIQALGSQLKTYGQILPTLAGTQQLLTDTAPALTRGERRFEAQRIQNDPKYAQIARSLATELGNLGGQQGQAKASAEAYANARAAEESDIASRSKGFLSSEFTGLQGQLGQKAQTKETQRSTLLQAMRDFGTSGDLSKLQGFQGAPTAEDFQKFALPPEAIQAQTARKDIDSRYQDIKDVPELTYRETKKGSIAPGIPNEWWNSAGKKYTEAEKRTIRTRAIARQDEYRKAGLVGTQIFAPHLYAHNAVAGHEGRGLSAEEAPYIYGIQPGALEAFSGLEFGGSDPVYGTGLGAYENPDPRTLIDFANGSGVPYTPENVASTDERSRYGRLVDLLGSNQQLGVGSAAVDPSISFHPERGDPAAEGKRRKEALHTNAIQFAQMEYQRHKGKGGGGGGEGPAPGAGKGYTGPPPGGWPPGTSHWDPQTGQYLRG